MQHLVLHPQNVISDEDVSIQNLFLLSIYCHCKSFLSVKTDGCFSYEQLTSMHSILYVQANLACHMFSIRTHYKFYILMISLRYFYIVITFWYEWSLDETNSLPQIPFFHSKYFCTNMQRLIFLWSLILNYNSYFFIKLI